MVTTLKYKKRNVLEFITYGVVTAHCGRNAPSLLPEATTCSNNSEKLKAA
ncbi:hypothetical protein [Trichormus azollae]